MATTTMPRAFFTFDPAAHVAKCREPSELIRTEMIGIDIGSGAPCVALHARLLNRRTMEVYREAFAEGVGLSAFIADEALGQPQAERLVCAEAAIVNRSPVDNRSPKQVLEAAGHRVLVCKSSPAWRWKSINARLQRRANACGIVVDPSCTHLIAALIGHRTALAGEGVLVSSTPQHQHCIDALGYVIEGFARWLTCEHVTLTGVAADALG